MNQMPEAVVCQSRQSARWPRHFFRWPPLIRKLTSFIKIEHVTSPFGLTAGRAAADRLAPA
jgi:hypothetical protein